jgi:hypothetical protein
LSSSLRLLFAFEDGRGTRRCDIIQIEKETKERERGAKRHAAEAPARREV